MANNSTHLRAQDLRAIYLLLGECCELGADPLVWRRHLLTQLNRVFGAVSSVDIEARLDFTPGMPVSGRVDAALTIDAFSKFERQLLTRCMQQMRIDDNALGAVLFAQSQERGVATGTRNELIADSRWQRCVFKTEYMTPLDWRDSMMGICNRPSGFRSFVFTTQRGDPDFKVHSACMLDLLIRELLAIPETRLASLDGGSLLRLPRRLRQVVDGLAQGDTEKQIALRLGISRSTTHEYVRRLHKLFGVSTRGQLLTRLARQVHCVDAAEELGTRDCWYFRQAAG